MSSLILKKIERHQKQQRKENNEAIFKTKRKIIFEKEEEDEEIIVDKKCNIMNEEQFQKIQIYIFSEYDHLKVFIEKFKQFSSLVKICIDYLQPHNNEQLQQMVNLLNIHKLLKSSVKQIGNDQCIPIQQKKKLLEEFQQGMEKFLFSKQSQNDISLTQYTYKGFANLEANLKYEALKQEMQKKERENLRLLMVQQCLKTFYNTNYQLEERLKRHNEEFRIYKDKKLHENGLLEKEILVLKSVIRDLKDQLKVQYPQLQQLPIIEPNENNENLQFQRNNKRKPQKEKKKQKKNQEFIF